MNTQPHCSLLTAASAFGSEASTVLRISVLLHVHWLVIVVPHWFIVDLWQCSCTAVNRPLAHFSLPTDNLAFGSESTIVLRVIFVVVWPPSLCCCISVGLLLNLAATVTPEIRTHIPTSPVIGGAKLYTSKARISTAATNQM